MKTLTTTATIDCANESIKLIKRRMKFMTTQKEIDEAVLMINKIRTLIGA